ncbi:hypothetical protein CR513_60706, partial [Mucuna pruriens]
MKPNVIMMSRCHHYASSKRYVDEEVQSIETVFPPACVALFAEHGKWHEEASTVPCSSTKQVCHMAREGELSFIYLYETIVKDLGVTLPFSVFDADVFRTLGLVPIQLHPNGLATMQTFKLVCRALLIYPTAPLFLYHYTT